MQNSQERALIEAAAGGDPAAFEKLMRMHEGKMYAVALRREVDVPLEEAQGHGAGV